MRNKQRMYAHCAVLCGIGFVCMFCLSRLLWAQTQKEASQNDAMEAKIHQLIEKMTIEEEAGQLTLEPAGPIHGTDFKPSHTDMDILAGKVGALEGSIGISTANYYQHLAIEKSRLHIPLMFGLNVVHGYRTVFPVPLAMAGTFDPELVRSATAFSAAEARADGVTWTNAPMVDIARDGRWGRIVEGAGPDPYLGAVMARAYVQGFQQDDLSKPTALASCTKHYAAYGAPIGGKDYYAVDMSELMLRQDYLPPYRAAVDAGTACIMASFNSLNGIPMHANSYLLQEILRKEWGFKGFVISDANGISELVNHGTAVDAEDAARQALLSGVDMDLGALAFQKQIPKLVQQGRIPKAALDEAVAHVLRIKYKLGLFEHPYVDDSHTTITPSAEGRALALHVAEESAVLLKNDAIGGGAPVLPLSSQNRSVALIGPLADSKGNMLGSWAGNGKAEDAVTLRAALEERLHGNLHYAQGTEIESQDETGFAAAVKAAQDSDVAILALGEAASKTGEASSRAFLDLPGNQQKLFEAIARTGRPIILILFNGHPLVLTPFVHHAQAIVEAWYPGIEGGHALANLLYGETNPNGKLTVDLPRSVGQEPLFYMQMPTGRPVRNIDLSHFPAGPSERFTARYLDEQNTGLYPFGWGLSYTTFSYSEPKVERQNDASFLVTVHVKNTGTRTGTEVAQLYLGSKGGSIEQPLRLLKGFQRVTLRAGEDRRVQFTLGPEELSMYNATLKRVVEPILYDIWVGGSSLAQEHVQLDRRGTKEIQLDQH